NAGVYLDGTDYVSLPNISTTVYGQDETIEAWFQTTTGGVILGTQDGPAFSSQLSNWGALLYVGTDGKLRSVADFEPNFRTSDETVADGLWHHVALVDALSNNALTLYLDGRVVGSTNNGFVFGQPFNQIGTGFTRYFSDATDGWYSFQGRIDQVRIWSVAR